MLYLQKTNDGSFTLQNSEIDEGYHSSRGAKSESEYVFIQQGLAQMPVTPAAINLLEVGFGTGLNTLQTYLWAERKQVNLSYTALEPYPIPHDIIQALAEQDSFLKTHHTLFQKLHGLPFETTANLTKRFRFLKTATGIQDYIPKRPIQLIYFDAFSPNKAPGLWQPMIFENLFRQMAPGGILVTYCAKGQVKRTLKTAGFIVETLPGALGKREMIRVKKPLNQNSR